MNRVVNFYKKFGKSSNKVMGLLKLEPVFKGVPVPFKQTPGQHQYYYSETLHLIPGSILYQIRMPNRYAVGTESTKYSDIVEKEILKYLEQKVPHNLFSPKDGLNLNITIKQAKHLVEASEEHFVKAESGELQKMLDEFQTSQERIDQLQDRIETAIDDLLVQARSHLKETLSVHYTEADIEKSIGFFDGFPLIGRDVYGLAIADVQAALERNPSDQKLIELQDRLFHVAYTHFQIADIKLSILDPDGYETYDKVSYEEALHEFDNAKAVLDRFTRQADYFKSPFKAHLDEIQIKLVPEFKECALVNERARDRKDNFYSKVVRDNQFDAAPNKFKEELLAYLSGAIILKTHRYRYQQEQYDRYLAFNKWISLSDNMTLKEFAGIYARSLRTQVEISHNFLCPQIDANYDEYGKKTVNPISPNVFYFFFSANRMRRRWAQIVLSAARFPNEKIRRAYLRFFNNA